VQRLRAASCAIVTGSGTVLDDDCALTVRDESIEGLAQMPAPLRVVLDSRLRTPAQAKVLDGAAPTLLCHDARAEVPAHLADPGCALLGLPGGDAGLDLGALMAELAARQANEILVESGPRLAGALLQAGLLDELIVYMAPLLMGDRARPLLDLPLDAMAQSVPLQVEDVRRVGQDWRFTLKPDIAASREG
jgi:diaminohydroxyphosphoribosylaminopyrimidine deaminase/5-amino-6-(5-phosphoribosylamino)uracil reductase